MTNLTDKTLGLIYPCDIDVKIFIKNDQAILAIMETFTLSHLAEGQLRAWRYRESSGGKYLSISATVAAQSREHIDAFFQALHDHQHVIMTI